MCTLVGLEHEGVNGLLAFKRGALVVLQAGEHLLGDFPAGQTAYRIQDARRPISTSVSGWATASTAQKARVTNVGSLPGVDSTVNVEVSLLREPLSTPTEVTDMPLGDDLALLQPDGPAAVRRHRLLLVCRQAVALVGRRRVRRVARRRQVV